MKSRKWFRRRQRKHMQQALRRIYGPRPGERRHAFNHVRLRRRVFEVARGLLMDRITRINPFDTPWIFQRNILGGIMRDWLADS